MKGKEEEERREGKDVPDRHNTTPSRPSPSYRQRVFRMPGGAGVGERAFWKVPDKGPMLTVASCLPVLRRNFPFLIDYEKQMKRKLVRFQKRRATSHSHERSHRATGQWLLHLTLLVQLRDATYMRTRSG